jgi:hypothetical protein
VHRFRAAARQEIADGEFHLVRIPEVLLVEIMHMEFDGDELQLVIIRDNDTDGNAGIFDYLLLH